MKQFHLVCAPYSFSELVATARGSFMVCLSHLVIIHGHVLMDTQQIPESMTADHRKIIDGIETVADYLNETFTALYDPDKARDGHAFDLDEASFVAVRNNLIRKALIMKYGTPEPGPQGVRPLTEHDLFEADVADWAKVAYFLRVGATMNQLTGGYRWVAFPEWNITPARMAFDAIRVSLASHGWVLAWTDNKAVIQDFAEPVGSALNPTWIHHQTTLN